MKTLIKMTDYVKEQTNKITNEWSEDDQISLLDKISNYANFLSQTPQLYMFVPSKLVDGVWVVLEKETEHSAYADDLEYQQAKERCYFEGFEVKERNCNEAKFKYIENGLIAVFYYNKTTNSFEENADFKTLEDLIPYNLTLTATAQKEIV